MSVTKPPKISMGASNEPAVVILLYESLSLWYICCAQACFGGCSQWGYWARVRNVEGCFAAPGVRVSHSPHPLSTCSLKVNYFVLESSCSHTCPGFEYLRGELIAAFFISTLLPCWFLLAFVWVGAAIAWDILFVGCNQTVLCCFFAVEDGSAGATDRYAVLDFFRADGAIRQRAGIVEPRLLESELACGA